jgi:hypothetical protein
MKLSPFVWETPVVAGAFLIGAMAASQAGWSGAEAITFQCLLYVVGDLNRRAGEAETLQWQFERATANLMVCRPETPCDAMGFHEQQLPWLNRLSQELHSIDDFILWFYTPLALPAYTNRSQSLFPEPPF